MLSIRKLISISLIIFKLTVIIISHKCIHDKLNIKPEVNKLMPKHELRFLQSQAWTPINIYADYTYMDTEKVDADKIAFAKKVIANTFNVYQNLLKVQRVSKSIVIDSCSEFKADKLNKDLTTQGKGIAADLVIIPFFDLVAEQNTEAYAAACSMDPNNFRPIAGVMAFNPQNFIIDRANALQYYTMLVIHEFNHILCFSEGLYEYFIDSSFKILSLNKIIKDTTINGVPRKIIITPKVVQAARKHFACSTLEGVELEDQGGSGTANCHWESRVMLGDYMMGESYPENVISEISLALFEDSGWYKANYYTGGLFRYGKNKGCNFVLQKCIIDGKSNFPNEFCTVAGASMCFPSKTSKGECSIGKQTSTIPEPYRYYTDPILGGFLYADFCPLPKFILDSKNQMYFSSSCAYGLTNFPTLGESIGTDSGCFMSSLVPKANADFSIMKESNRAICYNYFCNKADQTYTVKFLTYTIICPKEGGEQTLPDVDGKFYCSDFNTVCTKTASCKDAIECAINKVSYEFPTYDYTPSGETPSTSTGTTGTTNGTTPGNTNTGGSQDVPKTVSIQSEYLKSFAFIYMIFLIFIFGN